MGDASSCNCSGLAAPGAAPGTLATRFESELAVEDNDVAAEALELGSVGAADCPNPSKAGVVETSNPVEITSDRTRKLVHPRLISLISPVQPLVTGVLLSDSAPLPLCLT